MSPAITSAKMWNASCCYFSLIEESEGTTCTSDLNLREHGVHSKTKQNEETEQLCIPLFLCIEKTELSNHPMVVMPLYILIQVKIWLQMLLGLIGEVIKT